MPMASEQAQTFMMKEVWITIRSLQNVGADEQEPTELVSAGTYYNRNGKHYVLYDTAEEDFALPTANMVKIGPDSVELTRKGSQAVRMVFRQGIRTLTEYPTSCGSLLLGITTCSIQIGEAANQVCGTAGQIRETEEQINVRMEYTLDADGDRIADFVLTMRIRPRAEIPE